MYRRYFEFAGINIQIESDVPLEIVDYFAVFEKEYSQDMRIDVFYKIKQVDAPVVLHENPVFVNDRMSVYHIDNTEYRQFPWWSEYENYPITLKCGNTTPMYCEFLLTKSQMQMFANKMHFSGYLAMERVMLKHNGFQLHASVVMKHGKGVLFTAPSGTGKSTQAALWEKYEDATVINGDKALIRKQEDGFMVYGSPYAGTSQIYKNLSAPVSCIVVLSQAEVNRLQPLTKAEAFKKIYKESAVNVWNGDFVVGFAGLLQELVSTVPVYHLACRPDQSAVEILKKELQL